MVLGSRAAIGGVLGSGRGGAAAQWWLASGVSAANCVAAYQPIGAVSLAASYDNNAAPGNGLADGTYDAAPGVAPTWAAATGWTFDGLTTYLLTGITPATGWSAFVRFSDASASNLNFLFGSQGTGAASNYLFGVWPITNGGTRSYHNSGLLNKSDSVTSGVLGFAGQTAYKDGSAETGTISTRAGSLWREIYIGCRNNGIPEFLIAAKIQALAFYNTTLTAPQVAAISAAMAAL